MKITISTLGSRGDVQPYLALAAGLQQSGHRVTLAAPGTFADWIKSYGVEAVPVRFNPQDAMRKLGQGATSLHTLPAMLRILRDGMQAAQDDVWEASLAADFFIQSGTGMGAMELTSLKGTPGAFAYLFPFAPTRALPMFWLPVRYSLGGRYNLLTHTIMRRVLWSFGGRMTNEWRGRLGLPPWRSAAAFFEAARSQGMPFLLGYSPALIPTPSDWDGHQHVTGYWFLDQPPGWQPPAGLLRFLDRGPPPVYIGFGSMNHRNPERLTRAALGALEETGLRGILHTGWGGIKELPSSDNVYYAGDVPHAWLFPRLAAVVHHGGAGTTAADLRAGVPNIIAPFGGDQYSWADMVVKAGVGFRIKGIRWLTADRLAGVLGIALSDAKLRERATALGETIRSENGIARAVEIIELRAR